MTSSKGAPFQVEHALRLEPFCQFSVAPGPLSATFSREHRLQLSLRVEATVASVQAELSLIPKPAAADIARAAWRVTPAMVDRFEDVSGHEVFALVSALGAACEGAGAQFVHFGLTSSDVTDSVQAIQISECVRRWTTRLSELYAVALSGGEIALSAELYRHNNRLQALVPRSVVGKVSGAVGSASALGPRAHELEERVCRRLGIGVELGPTQIVQRDRLVEFFAWIAGASSSIERHLRPLTSTNSAYGVAQARLARSYLLPVMESAAIQWHERDLSNSSVERIALSHAAQHMDAALSSLGEEV